VLIFKAGIEMNQANYKYTAFFAFLTAFGLFLFSCGKKKQGTNNTATAKKQMPPAKVDGYVVTPSDLTDRVELTGNITAGETTEIRPEIAGRITLLHLPEGKYVSKGTLLAKLYDGDLRAQLAKLEVQLRAARVTEARQEQLLKIEGISKQEYELSQLQVNTIKADMHIIRTSMIKTEIRAPYSGKLGLKNISPGAYITPADILTTLRKTDEMKLDFNVPEKYAHLVKPGQNVAFTDDATNARFSARIDAMESGITENNRALLVRADITGGDDRLIHGSFARINLDIQPGTQSLMVPSQAILPQARGKKVIAYKGGTAQFIEVTTGIRDSAFVEITSGLQTGDTIVVTGLMSTKPGAKINIGKLINQ
jgi:membrane fusion protein (multidrug efflux system)